MRHNSKTLKLAFIFLVNVIFFNDLFSRPVESQSPYEILRSIKSPQDMLFPIFPKQFCVPVNLSGSIAEEINSSIKSIGLESPQYKESFNGSTFNLYIANDSYAEQTKDMLSGVLNPLEMIDLIVQSLVKYRSPQQFNKLIAETNLELRKTAVDPSYVDAVLTPRGNRFAYVYDDNGAYIHESWITELKLTIDSPKRIVNEIDVKKISRQFSTDQITAPQFDTILYKYAFNYTELNGSILPYQLQIFTNNKLSLEISVLYREEDSHIVFDKKVISSIHDTQRADLTVSYGDYSSGACEHKKNTSEQINRKLIAASALSKKALDQLHKGNISGSARVLGEIVSKYDGTPQAIEARRLLSQLPSDLR
jgi:hypothetical protein